MKKPSVWNMKASPAFIKTLNAASNVLDKPAAQIVREAVAEKLAELAKKNRRLKRAIREAEAA